MGKVTKISVDAKGRRTTYPWIFPKTVNGRKEKEKLSVEKQGKGKRFNKREGKKLKIEPDGLSGTPGKPRQANDRQRTQAQILLRPALSVMRRSGFPFFISGYPPGSSACSGEGESYRRDAGLGGKPWRGSLRC